MKRCQAVTPCDSPATQVCVKESSHKTKSHRRATVTYWCDWHADKLKRINDAAATWSAIPEIRTVAHFDEHDCGGVFDGNGVVSDADSGL